MSIQLVPIDSVRPSTYNPRIAGKRRLEILSLSLRKMGFVLPLFADDTGEIISGHQRHLVASEMGVKELPVVFAGEMVIADRKAMNIAFNRGTNDMAADDTPKNITEALSRIDLQKLADALPDLDVESDEFFRCLHPETVELRILTKKNKGRWVHYARNMASTLAKRGIEMPIVCTPDNRVVNGIGRLQFYAERGREDVEVIYITEAEQAFASAMLNLLSMDFDIHNRYEDLLRYNSFRRARRVRSEMGQGFIFKIHRGTSKTFDVQHPDSAEKWKRTYGTSVVDFGAGHLHETDLLRSIDVRVAAFEPFRITDADEIDKRASIDLTERFLDDVEAGTNYSSVFISSVLNSVPFLRDREHIACIAAALCGPSTRLHALATSQVHENWLNVRGRSSLSERRVQERTFALEYETGITLGDFASKPKVQKYHTQKEFYELFKPYFGTVSVGEGNTNIQATCADPLPIDGPRLRQAIEFEFDLPYPDGSKMELVERALVAFTNRLSLEL